MVLGLKGASFKMIKSILIVLSASSLFFNQNAAAFPAPIPEPAHVRRPFVAAASERLIPRCRWTYVYSVTTPEALVAWNRNETCEMEIESTLEQFNPAGLRIFKAEREFFSRWVCSEKWGFNLENLSLATHETLHYLDMGFSLEALMATANPDSDMTLEEFFPLLRGDFKFHMIIGDPLPMTPGPFFGSEKILHRFEVDTCTLDYFNRPTVEGGISFIGLLGEWSAASHDLWNTLMLNNHGQRIHFGENQIRLLSFMYGIKLYLDKSVKSFPETWEELMKPDRRLILQGLWDQSEMVLQENCKIQFQNNQKPLWDLVYSDTHMAALEAVLGRKPAKPEGCESSSEQGLFDLWYVSIDGIKTAASLEIIRENRQADLRNYNRLELVKLKNTDETLALYLTSSGENQPGFIFFLLKSMGPSRQVVPIVLDDLELFLDRFEAPNGI